MNDRGNSNKKKVTTNNAKKWKRIPSTKHKN